MRQERGITQNIQDRSITYRDNAIGPTASDIRHSRRQRVKDHVVGFLKDDMGLGRVTTTAVLVVAAVGAVAGGYFVTRGNSGGENGQRGNNVTQPTGAPKSHDAGGTAGSAPTVDVKPTPTPTASGRSVDTLQSQDSYTLLNIESEAWAAQTFGADDWSRNPANWDIVNQPNGDKFAHLKQRPNEVHTMVDLSKDSRAVGQAWVKIRTTDSGVETINGNVVTNAQAEVIVFKGLKAEVKEITIRLADNSDALLKDSVAKMVAKEAIEQPGTPVLQCAPIDTNVTPYSLIDIQSQAWAAQTFGADDWSRNPANWDIVNQPNGDKFAHLKQRPNEVHTMVDLSKDSRAVGQAWVKIRTTDSGVERFVNDQVLDAQAETIVFRNEKGEVKEVTIRIADNTTGLMADSFNKMATKEAIEQPGTPVLSCQPATPPTTQSVPSPSLPPAK